MMHTVRFATAVSLGIACHAMGTSTVTYTPQLGGDNHAAAWEAGNPMTYTPGSSLDGQVYVVGDVLTWDVVLEASGIHSQPGHASDGFEIQGVANFVFDLELHEGTAAGPLAAAAVFFSSIHDGDGGDGLENAAFALSYDVAGNGPGSVINGATEGGPNMGASQFPTSHDAPIPDNPLVNAGELVGMGAGYILWDRTPGSPFFSTPGVGMNTLPDESPGLGVVPVAEGQIDTSNLTPGAYVLRVIPAPGGTNVLRGDVDLLTGQGINFAVAANQTIGDDITFQLAPEPGTLVLLAIGCLTLLPRRR